MARDKFAAMASRGATDSGGTEAGQTEGEPATSTATTTTTTTPVEPPRRDKLAAMASRGTPPAPSGSASAPSGSRGNSKLAAMAASAPAAPPEEQQRNDEAEAKEKHLKGIKEKLSKRKRILENLDRAEDLTFKLLQIAHQTTRSLEDLSCAPNISELSRTYRETLRELHPLLSTDTEDLIQPYQNHSTETKQSMYAARVEMRLAKERTQVLKVITELEKKQRQGKEENTLADNKKRPRE
jgi:hypothetical protein